MESGKKVKSEEQQKYEQTSRVLTCTPLTSSVNLDFKEQCSKHGTEKIWRGGAARMRNGWFRVLLDDDY